MFFFKTTEWVFTSQPKSGPQGLEQIWFIGSSCSSFHMGLLLLALLALLLAWGYYSSPLAITFFLLLLLLFSLLPLFFSHYSFSSPVAVTFLTWCCSFTLAK
jgi:hypothetical protein